MPEIISEAVNRTLLPAHTRGGGPGSGGKHLHLTGVDEKNPHHFLSAYQRLASTKMHSSKCVNTSDYNIIIIIMSLFTSAMICVHF